MNTIEDLFSDTNVVSTADVARAFELSEADARAWADELGVAKVGASFAWAQPDVEGLAGQLDALETETEDEEEEDDDEEEEDDEPE